MRNTWIKIETFIFVVFLISVMSLLTMQEEEDTCAGTQTDISAAVIADQPGDQDALVNRAIIMRGKCERKEEGPKE